MEERLVKTSVDLCQIDMPKSEQTLRDKIPVKE